MWTQSHTHILNTSRTSCSALLLCNLLNLLYQSEPTLSRGIILKVIIQTPLSELRDRRIRNEFALGLAETLRMFKKAFGYYPMSPDKNLGANTSNLARISLKTMHILEVIQIPKHSEMLNARKLQSKEIAHSQCDNEGIWRFQRLFGKYPTLWISRLYSIWESGLKHYINLIYQLPPTVQIWLSTTVFPPNGYRKKKSFQVLDEIKKALRPIDALWHV